MTKWNHLKVWPHNHKVLELKGYIYIYIYIHTHTHTHYDYRISNQSFTNTTWIPSDTSIMVTFNCHTKINSNKMLKNSKQRLKQNSILRGLKSGANMIDKILIVKWKSFIPSCPTFCDPMDYTVHGILQARILEWVAFPLFRGSSQPRIEPRSPTWEADSLTVEPQRKPQNIEK